MTKTSISSVARSLFLLTALAGFIFTGCKDVCCERSIIDSNPPTVTIPGDGGDEDIVITSPVGWKVIEKPSWVTVNPMSGSGTMEVNISADANTTGASRSGKVVILADNGDKVEIWVTQPGLETTILFALEGVDEGTPALVTFTNGTTRAATVDASGEIIGYASESALTVRSLTMPGFNAGDEVLVGRKANKTIYLKFNASGALVHRPADSEGFVPIGSYDEFQLINTVTSGFGEVLGSYRQEADLDLMEEEWEPIGGPIFVGYYDGGGYDIHNLKIDDHNTSSFPTGLFRWMECNPAGIRNVHIRSGSIKGNNMSGTGAICGFVHDEITIAFCSNVATVTSVAGVGGILGIGNCPKITNCSNSGKITGNDFVGGVVGITNHRILYSSNSGEVTALVGTAGGLVGYAGSGGDIKHCYNTGEIYGATTAGGVAGSSNTYIAACFNAGDVYGLDQHCGGVVGWNRMNGWIIACYNTGKNLGLAIFAGGVVGYNDDNGQVIACYNTGTNWHHGLVGGQDGMLAASYWLSGTASWFLGYGGGFGTNVDVVEFTLPYTFTPNTTLYPEWTINPDGTGPVGYWKDYSTGGLPKLWWE